MNHTFNISKDGMNNVAVTINTKNKTVSDIDVIINEYLTFELDIKEYKCIGKHDVGENLSTYVYEFKNENTD